MRRIHSAVAAAAALVTLPISAQDARTLVPAVTPIHTAPADPIGGEYGIWAAGTDYKVSFHDGMAFVPYLGKDYPRTQRLGWRTAGITAGGEPLMGHERVVATSHTDLRFEYRHGSFTEAYDVHAGGVEQSFVIHARPAAAGPITVTGALDTELIADAVTARHTGLAFRDRNGDDILSYGAATAIDARGRTTRVLTTYDGRTIELTVPAAFVAAAAFPLVIDPLLTARYLADGSTGGVLATTDVCRDDRYDRLVVAYSRYVANGDLDCWATEWNDDLQPGTQAVLFADLSSNWRTAEIRCATAGSPSRYCIAIVRRFSTGYHGVRYHLHDAGDRSLQTAVRFVSLPASTSDWHCDVGGTTYSANGDHFLLTWQRDADTRNTSTSEIWATAIDVGAGTHGAPVQLTASTTTHDCEFPSVNQTERATANKLDWVVCWQQTRGGALTWSVAARRVFEDLSLSPSGFVENLGIHHLRPQIAGSGGRYAISFGTAAAAQMQNWTSSAAGFGLQVVRLDWPVGGSPASMKAGIVKDHRYYNSARWQAGGIAFDHETRSHWAFTYTSDPTGGGTGSAYVCRLGFRGQTLESNVQIQGPRSGYSSVSPAATFDGDNDRFPLAWAYNSNTSGGATGNHFLYPAVQPAAARGASCSGTAIAWTGAGQTQQIGHEFAGVYVSGAPAGTTHFVLLSLVAQDAIMSHPFIGSGCRLHVSTSGPGYLGVLPPRVGSSAFWSLPLPEFIDPVTIYAQDWHLAANGAQIVSSARLEVPLVK